MTVGFNGHFRLFPMCTKNKVHVGRICIMPEYSMWWCYFSTFLKIFPIGKTKMVVRRISCLNIHVVCVKVGY